MPAGIAITFPSSPVEGQTYLAQNGFTYVYDSQKNRWDRGGSFVRPPKVLTLSGIAVTTTGSGIFTGPNGSLVYAVSGGSSVPPSSVVGLDSFKAYRTTDSYPNYSEIQVSISSSFNTIAFAATFADTTYTIPAGSLNANTDYYIRARQLVGSNVSTASTGAISGYSQNIVKFTTQSVYLDTPTIVSIAGSTSFPVYQIGYASTTLPATVTYTGGGVTNLDKVEYRVTGPRIPSSPGNTALAEVGIGTHSSITLANALVLAMPFSGASGVGITSDVNNAIRTASGASAGTTKTITAVGGIGTASVGTGKTTHFYPNAAYFPNANTSGTLKLTADSSDFAFGTGNFTVEYWVYPTSFWNYNTHVTTRTNNGPFADAWHIGTDSTGQIGVYSNGYDISGDSSTTIPTNTWSHICLVNRSGVLSLYINGVIRKSNPSYSKNTTKTALGIGQFPSSDQEAFAGYLQDVKIYKGLAKYTENFTPPLPTYGTISYTTGVTNVGVATTAFYESTGDTPTAEVAIGSSTAAQVANSLVLAMPMNRTFGFQDINVAIRGLTSGASAGTAKTVGLGTTSTANARTHPRISSSESKWYDGAAYFDGEDYATIPSNSDFYFNTSFTVECWINPTNFTNGNIFFVGDWASNQGIILGYNGSGYPTISVNAGGTGTVTGSSSLSLNSWNHLAYVSTGPSGTNKIYLNGVEIASTTQGNPTNNTSNIVIGAYVDSNYQSLPRTPLTSHIQDLKVYKGFAKYTANFTPPQPICGFTTDVSTQTGFTTTSAAGALLSSAVGLGTTSTLAFSADQTYAGITSITSSSGITTLTDSYAQNLVLALPLANITGVGNSFTNDRNTQIRSTSLVAGGTTKTITNNGVSISTTSKWYGNSVYFDGGDHLVLTSGDNFYFGTNDFTIESWVNYSASGSLYSTSSDQSDWKNIGTGYLNMNTDGSVNYINTGGSQSNLNPITTSPTNQWFHLAFVKSRNTLTCYLNGIFNGQATDVNSILGNSSAGVPAISKWDTYTGGRGYITGYLQDYRIYTGVAKYTTNFTPPPPMFGDYTRSTPNKVIFTPGSDYVLEARNTSGVTTSSYSATRQWGTKAKGGIYDPYAANLVLALPMNNTTTLYDTTGQIKLETPTSSYSSGQTVTSPSGSTYTNKSVTNNSVTFVTTQSKYYGYSAAFSRASAPYLSVPDQTDLEFGSGDFTFEVWLYLSNSTNQYEAFITKPGASDANGINFYKETNGVINFSATIGVNNWNLNLTLGHCGLYVNRWAHFAVTRKDQITTGWVDGVQIARSTTTGSIIDNSGVLNIGRYTLFPGNVTLGFDGYMSDLRIYKGIAKYTSNFTPPNQIYLT